jgi:hypothetical protein
MAENALFQNLYATTRTLTFRNGLIAMKTFHNRKPLSESPGLNLNICSIIFPIQQGTRTLGLSKTFQKLTSVCQKKDL